MHQIRKLRCYKGDGMFLEFIEGEEVRELGRIIKIEQLNDRDFKIYYANHSHNIVSGFPFVVNYK